MGVDRVGLWKGGKMMYGCVLGDWFEKKPFEDDDRGYGQREDFCYVVSGLGGMKRD